MQKSVLVEVWVGVFVAIGIAALLFLAFSVSNLSDYQGDESYELMARFTNVGGLKPRSPVTVSGVKIGEVKKVYFDQEMYDAVVILNINSKYDALPEDTSASIFTAGLLGEQYIGLDPGGSDEYLEDGSEITLTQSAIILEKVIGEFLFRQAQSGDDDE